jgi:hypothetical protein
MFTNRCLERSYITPLLYCWGRYLKTPLFTESPLIKGTTSYNTFTFRGYRAWNGPRKYNFSSWTVELSEALTCGCSTSLCVADSSQRGPVDSVCVQTSLRALQFCSSAISSKKQSLHCRVIPDVSFTKWSFHFRRTKIVTPSETSVSHPEAPLECVAFSQEELKTEAWRNVKAWVYG